jgi:hypothetical protein
MTGAWGFLSQSVPAPRSPTGELMRKYTYEANDELKRELFIWHSAYLIDLGEEDGCCSDGKFNADSHLSEVIRMVFLGEPEDQAVQL